eukprot:7261338-Pyramimonas_sp.AAC.1
MLTLLCEGLDPVPSARRRSMGARWRQLPRSGLFPGLESGAAHGIHGRGPGRRRSRSRAPCPRSTAAGMMSEGGGTFESGAGAGQRSTSMSRKAA